jgi:hypothetical protein
MRNDIQNCGFIICNSRCGNNHCLCTVDDLPGYTIRRMEMSNWKVFAAKIELFPHPNATSLELGKIGSFQVVVGKGEYKEGQIVVFAPKHSILPDDLKTYYISSKGFSYLGGKDQNRVLSTSLRGELSEGVVLPTDWVNDKLNALYLENNAWEWQLGADISKLLGIKEYFPSPVPIQFVPRDSVSSFNNFYPHDVEQFAIYQDYFKPGDDVVVTEKLNGLQICVAMDKDGIITVSSKGATDRGFVLKEFLDDPWWHGRNVWRKLGNLLKWLWRKMKNNKCPRSLFWTAAINSGLFSILALKFNPSLFHEIQIFGEVIPSQTGFTYGQDRLTVRVFRIIQDGDDLPYGTFLESIWWVPLLYSGPYDLEKIKPLREGMETVSGNSLHIREGVVLRHRELKFAEDGTPLIVKLLNSKYKEDDDAQS